MIIIYLLSILGDLNMTDDCCTVETAGLVVMELNIS